MNESELFDAYRGVAEDWVIRELRNQSVRRYYVQHRVLGYCTDVMTFDQAVREARRRNQGKMDG